MLLSAAGCGDSGSEPLSATAYRERANAICRELKQANEKAFAGLDTDDESALMRATEEVGRRTTKALDDLGELEGPAASEAGVDRLLARAEELREANTRQSKAISTGTTDAAERAEADAKRLSADVQTAARDAGLDACT